MIVLMYKRLQICILGACVLVLLHCAFVILIFCYLVKFCADINTGNYIFLILQRC